MRTQTRARRRDEPLSRDRIVDAALALIDELGIDRFSMRRLATRLRVDPMSVYYHLPSRGAVLDGVVDRLMQEADLPQAPMRWQDWVKESATRFVRLAETHPHSFGLFQLRGISSPDAFRPMEALADSLIRGGFTLDDAWEVVLVFSNYVVAVGLGLSGFGRRELWAGSIEPAEPRRELMSPEDFPRLHEMDTESVTPASIFHRGLEALINGFEADLRRRRRRQ